MLFIKDYIDNKIHNVPYFDEKPKKNILKKIKGTMVHFNFCDLMYDLTNFNITHISLGKEFEGELPKLPNTLKYLHFETFSFFDQILDLPPNIEYLSLGYGFNSKFDLRKNTKLKYILINYSYTHNLIDCLPPSIETIEFVGKLNFNLNLLLTQLPNLQEIIFEGTKINYNLDFKHNNQLKKILFNHNSKFDKYILNVPTSLTHLKLNLNSSNNIPKPLQNLSSQLTNLEIDGSFNYPLDEYLNESLISLEIFNDDFNQNINHLLPKLINLKKLILGYGYTHQIQIPNNIKHFEILNDKHPQAELEIHDEDIDDKEIGIYSGEPYIGDEDGNKIGNDDNDSDFFF